MYEFRLRLSLQQQQQQSTYEYCWTISYGVPVSAWTSGVPAVVEQLFLGRGFRPPRSASAETMKEAVVITYQVNIAVWYNGWYS